MSISNGFNTETSTVTVPTSSLTAIPATENDREGSVFTEHGIIVCEPILLKSSTSSTFHSF